MKKTVFACLLTVCLLLFASAGTARIPDIYELVPASGICLDTPAEVPIYAGPTVQYPKIDGAFLNPAEPYICFGQSDSWSMVAQGTPDSFDTVGWVETAAIFSLMEPELSFSDRLPAMVEEDAPLSFVPETDANAPFMTVQRGEYVAILGRYKDALYIEVQLEESAVRGFIPESSIE